MPVAQARKVLEGELGGVPVDDVFEWIDLDKPLGSASVAQVCCRPPFTRQRALAGPQPGGALGSCMKNCPLRGGLPSCMPASMRVGR